MTGGMAGKGGVNRQNFVEFHGQGLAGDGDDLACVDEPPQYCKKQGFPPAVLRPMMNGLGLEGNVQDLYGHAEVASSHHEGKAP